MMTSSPNGLQAATDPPVDRRLWAGRLGGLLTVATFLLIGTGGLVTSYNAGLAVPDWPASFGKWLLLPAKLWMDLAVFLEHNHRLTGLAAGLICIATLVATVRAQGWKSRVSILACLVLVAYIYQGVIGGVRVEIVRQHPEWSATFATLHGVQGQLLFALVVVLAACLGKWRGRIQSTLQNHTGKPAISRAVYAMAWAFVVLMVVQLTVGAIIRHTNSASAIPDAPAVYGGFFPPSDPDVIAQKFYELGGGEWQVYVKEPALDMDAAKSDATPDVLGKTQRVPATPPKVGLVHNQYMHRVLGMVVLPILGMGLIHMLVKSYKTVPGLRGPVAVVSVLFVIQVLLGMSVIWSKESPYIASSHQAVGAAMLGMSTLILVRLHWARRFDRENRNKEAVAV